MAPRGLSSGPDAPLGASPESSPAVRESVSAPHDARAEFLDIVAHMDTPGVTESTTAIEAALTAAPSDAVRAAILAEISVNAGEIQMSVGDNQVLIDLVKKILSHAIWTNSAITASENPVEQSPKIVRFKETAQEKNDERGAILELITKLAPQKTKFEDSSSFDHAAAAEIAKLPDGDQKDREMARLHAEVILQDTAVQAEARERLGDAEYERSIRSLQAMFPDIRPAETIRPKAYVPPAYEKELMKRVGANPDIPTTRAGNRVTFATSETDADGYVKMTLDVSHEPPTVLRHGPNGTLVPMNLEGNKSFDRAYGLMRAAETASVAIDRLTSRRDQMLGDIDKIASSLHLDAGDSDDEPLDMVDNLIERAEARFAQDRLGTPPRIGAMDSALADALDGGDATAMQDVETSVPEEAMRGAERLLTQLKSIRTELVKLEDELARQTAEKLRLDTAKTAADKEFARHMEQATRNAELNMKSLEDAGVGELGQEGLTIIVRLLNEPNAMATLPRSVAIDLSKPLTLDQRLYIAHGMGLVFGDAAGLYDNMGALRPEARENPEALRKRLVERGVLDDAGDVRPFMLERVFEASLSAPTPTTR